MDLAQLLGFLGNLGTAGAVIFVVLKNNEERASRERAYADEREKRDNLFISQLEKIDVRNIEEQRTERAQNRNLFDKVISFISDLATTVKALTDATKANEHAIRELTEATRSNEHAIMDLRRQHQALPEPTTTTRELPRPLAPGRD